MTLRKRLAKLFGILCVFVGQGAGAQHRTDYLSFSSALPTEVVITLSGQVFYCDPFFGYFWFDPPTTSVSNGVIVIVTSIVGGECPPTNPPYPPPSPYSRSINAGVLPDGDYAIQWQWPHRNKPGIPVLAYSSRMRVFGGALDTIFLSGFDDTFQTIQP